MSWGGGGFDNEGRDSGYGEPGRDGFGGGNSGGGDRGGRSGEDRQPNSRSTLGTITPQSAVPPAAPEVNPLDTQIGSYNDALGGFRDSFYGEGGLSQRISQLDIRNVGDQYEGLTKELNTLGSSLGGLVRPTSVRGASVDLSPESAHFGLSSGISEALGTLNKINDERTREEKRTTDFKNSILDELGLLDIRANDLTVATPGGIDEAQYKLDALDRRKQSFSSSLYDDNPLDDTAYGDARQTLSDRLAGLETARLAEQKRIQTADTDFTSRVSELVEQLGGYGIDASGASGASDLIDELTGLRREISRFDSPLEVDFSDQLGDISSARYSAEGILEDRRNELARIEREQTGFLADADSIRAAIEGLTPENQYAITSAERKLGDLRDDISGFESEILPEDFASGALGVLDNGATAEEIISNIRQQRASNIEGFASQIEGITSGAEGAGDAVPFESDVLDRQEDLIEIQEALARYTGSDVRDVKASLATGLKGIDTQMEMIKNKRAELETAAQSLEDDIVSRQYRGFSFVDEAEQELADKRKMVDQHSARQAMDELNRIESFLVAQRNRLTADQTARASLQAQRENALLSSLTPSQITSLLGGRTYVDGGATGDGLGYQSASDEEEFVDPRVGSAFSQGLGA